MMKSDNKSVVVVGSVNVDLMLRCPHLPAAGETVLGQDFAQAAGGKGANQAIAAARLGADVSFVGCVGDDAYGQASRAAFEADKVDVRHLYPMPNHATGIAMIISDATGENCIGLAPGANHLLSIEHVNNAEALIAQAALVVCQLESPVATVLHALKLAKRHGVPFMLNPSPAQILPVDALAEVDVLVLNEGEAAILTGSTVENIDGARSSAEFLMSSGVKRVIITLGKNGAVIADPDGIYHYVPPKVKAVDTTGAGDTLVGALAAAWVSGLNLTQTMKFAQSAAAFSVTRRGAQASMPRHSDLVEFAATSLAEEA